MLGLACMSIETKYSPPAINLKMHPRLNALEEKSPTPIGQSSLDVNINR